MSKPYDVALAIQQKYGDENWSFELREAIHDAILAAKAEERESCAHVAEDYATPTDIWERQELMLARIATDYACIDIAAAIRKRGEA